MEEVLALRNAKHDTGLFTRLGGALVGCILRYGICIRKPRLWCMKDRSFMAGFQVLCNAGDIKGARRTE